MNQQSKETGRWRTVAEIKRLREAAHAVREGRLDIDEAAKEFDVPIQDLEVALGRLGTHTGERGDAA